MRWRAAGVVTALVPALLASACARQGLVVEVAGSVMYDKPRIESIAHTLTDERAEGGSVTIGIVMIGDPGLKASFDISPGIADHQPMKETSKGNYVGEFVLPRNTVGGPFSIFGRVVHEKAGEMVLRDSEPITIILVEHGG